MVVPLNIDGPLCQPLLVTSDPNHTS